LRRDNCQFSDYEAWLRSESKKIVTGPGVAVVGGVNPLGEPDSAPWHLDVAIIFQDSRYIRVFEYYRPLPKASGGGGCLDAFSYHYGPCTATRDADGFPKYLSRFDLRIDRDKKDKNHAHYMKENHIPEARLPGLDFDQIDPFKFIQAVLEHREYPAKPLHETLGFKVAPKK
jgi:hypothetical protein